MLEILQWVLIIGLVLALFVLNSKHKKQNRTIDNLTKANENLVKSLDGLAELVRQLGGWSRRR